MAFGLISITSAAIDPEQALARVFSPNMLLGIVSEQRTSTSFPPKEMVAISRSC